MSSSYIQGWGRIFVRQNQLRTTDVVGNNTLIQVLRVYQMEGSVVNKNISSTTRFPGFLNFATAWHMNLVRCLIFLIYKMGMIIAPTS